MKIVLGIIILGLFLIGCSSSGVTGNAVCDVNGGCDAGNDGEYIKIPRSGVSMELKKYSYDADGTEVTFFAVRGRDGKVRTAFDACDVCGGYKGYRQQGNDVTCNNCGRSFRITDIGTKNRGGGCWPSYLGHEVDGEHILVKKSEIAQGAFRFA